MAARRASAASGRAISMECGEISRRNLREGGAGTGCVEGFVNQNSGFYSGCFRGSGFSGWRDRPARFAAENEAALFELDVIAGKNLPKRGREQHGGGIR